MSSDNPYSALPSSLGGETSGAAGVVRDGKYVRTPVTGVWPGRCVVCNVEVGDTRFEAKGFWYPRWVIVVFIVSRLIGLILMMMKRRKLHVHVGLCEEHRAARRTRMWVFGSMMAAFLPAMVAGGVFDSGALFAFGGLLLLVGLIGAAVTWPVIRIHKVEGELAWVKVKPPFIDSLPDA